MSEESRIQREFCSYFYWQKVSAEKDFSKVGEQEEVGRRVLLFCKVVIREPFFGSLMFFSSFCMELILACINGLATSCILFGLIGEVVKEKKRGY